MPKLVGDPFGTSASRDLNAEEEDIIMVVSLICRRKQSVHSIMAENLIGCSYAPNVLHKFQILTPRSPLIVNV